MLPGVVGVDAHDADSHHGCCDAEDTNQGSKFRYFADDLTLLALLVGLGFVEEELVLFIASQLSFVGEQRQKAGCYKRPDQEQCGYRAHHITFLRPLLTGPTCWEDLRYLGRAETARGG